MLIFGRRHAFSFLEEARQVCLRRESQQLGHVFQRFVCGGYKFGYFVGYSFIYYSFGRSVGNLSCYLAQIACTYIQLLCVEGHIGIAVVVVLHCIQKLVVQFLTARVAFGIIGRQLLQICLSV